MIELVANTTLSYIGLFNVKKALFPMQLVHLSFLFSLSPCSLISFFLLLFLCWALSLSLCLTLSHTHTHTLTTLSIPRFVGVFGWLWNGVGGGEVRHRLLLLQWQVVQWQWQWGRRGGWGGLEARSVIVCSSHQKKLIMNVAGWPMRWRNVVLKFKRWGVRSCFCISNYISRPTWLKKHKCVLKSVSVMSAIRVI